MHAAKGRGRRLCAIALWMAADGAARGQNGNVSDSERRLARYVEVRLTADLSHPSRCQRKMIPHLIRAAEAMDEIFWLEAACSGKGLPSGNWKQQSNIRFVRVGSFHCLSLVPLLPNCAPSGWRRQPMVR